MNKGFVFVSDSLMEEAGTEERALLGSGASLRRLLGLWWPQTGRGRFRAAASASFSMLVVACLPSFTALKLIMDTSQELDEIALCSLVIFVSFGFVTKASFFIYQSNTLHQLLQVLHESRRFNRGRKNSEEIRRRYQKLSRRMYIFMQVTSLQALAGWVSAPLLVRAFRTSDEDSVESYRQFPVPLWFPGNIYLSPTYEILYLVQFLCIIVAPQTSTCINIFFIHMMLMVAAELEVLNVNVSSMQKVHLKLEGSEDQEQRRRNKEKYEEFDIKSNAFVHNIGDSSKEDVSDENINLMLVKNIQHHQVIIRSVSLLQRVMNVSIFILLFVNMTGLCSCLFVTAVLLQRDGSLAKALKSLLSILPLLYETGLYCIFGQILTDQSEKLVNSTVSCGWADCDTRFKRSLVVFLTVAGRPLEIIVGKRNKLSKETLVQVLNGSYGLLNLLYHFHNTQ
ncbi:odorant receptor 43a-like [Schistocerca nitens]|uniref:odorant receptor 43a-like n=1 Tax=Schistocerca nitens TaxID=7011 RepID=UPI002118F7EF|nr:odorant receptor 43a-like [Schistocerca nitens]